jgi:hypothetical protein
MPQKSKLLVLILSSTKTPWREIQEQGQDKTFLSLGKRDITYLRYIGQGRPPTTVLRMTIFWKQIQSWLYLKSTSFVGLGSLALIAYLRVGDKVVARLYDRPSKDLVLETQKFEGISPMPTKTLMTDTFDHWTLIGAKTISAFKYVLDNYDFDFLFRTNTSSYLDSQLLLDEVSNYKAQNLYGGVPGSGRSGRKFASGAGTLMSRDVVERVVDQSKNWRHGLIDDAALADLISNFSNPGTSLTTLKRVDFASLSEARRADEDLILSTYHFRCKTKSADETIEIMKYIHTLKIKNKSNF